VRGSPNRHEGQRGEWLHDVDGVLPSLWRAICWAKNSTVACPGVRLVHSAIVQRLLTSLAEQLQFFAATTISYDISLFLLQISRRCVSSRGVGNASCTPLHARSYLDEELRVSSHVGRAPWLSAEASACLGVC
jgi:hypothetical protein